MLPRVVDLAGDADLEEDDSEMMPASDPSRLFQSWSTMPMGVGMLWSFDDHELCSTADTTTQLRR
jgi:hypothetical protein